MSRDTTRREPLDLDLGRMNAHRLKLGVVTAEYRRACSGKATSLTASEPEFEMFTDPTF